MSAVVTAITAALAAMTVVLWLLAPWIIRFYLILNSTPSAPPEKALATKLLHYFAPQVFFLGAIVVSTALLNARHRFTAAALSPVLNNAHRHRRSAGHEVRRRHGAHGALRQPDDHPRTASRTISAPYSSSAWARPPATWPSSWFSCLPCAAPGSGSGSYGTFTTRPCARSPGCRRG